MYLIFYYNFVIKVVVDADASGVYIGCKETAGYNRESVGIEWNVDVLIDG